MSLDWWKGRGLIGDRVSFVVDNLPEDIDGETLVDAEDERRFARRRRVLLAKDSTSQLINPNRALREFA